MKYLGPLSSETSGGRTFWVDFQNQLNSNEYLSSINSIISSDTDLIISNETILTSGLTTEDSHLLPSGQAMSFYGSCIVEKTNLACITINYTTTANNSDSTKVQLKIVPEI